MPLPAPQPACHAARHPCGPPPPQPRAAPAAAAVHPACTLGRLPGCGHSQAAPPAEEESSAYIRCSTKGNNSLCPTTAHHDSKQAAFHLSCKELARPGLLRGRPPRLIQLALQCRCLLSCTLQALLQQGSRVEACCRPAAESTAAARCIAAPSERLHAACYHLLIPSSATAAKGTMP